MEKKICKPCFGRGFRKIEVFSDVALFPSQRPEEICSDISPVEAFRVERDPDDSDSPVRLRSDISMLFHAADTAKKIGTLGVQYFMNTKRTKTSSFQSQLDSMDLSDDEILSMVKSRHLQSPSEILAWSESINELAEDLKSDALKQLDYGKSKTLDSIDSDSDSGSGSTSQS
nr:MAG TPA: hypothetical protein [Microviridae sp.]